MVPGGTKQKSSRTGQLHSKRLVLLQLPACESHFQFYSGHFWIYMVVCLRQRERRPSKKDLIRALRKAQAWVSGCSEALHLLYGFVLVWPLICPILHGSGQDICFIQPLLVS
jgi:hypothetical protein